MGLEIPGGGGGSYWILTSRQLSGLHRHQQNDSALRWAAV